MIYPDYDTYQKLYGRYLKKSLETFFAKCGDLTGKRVLDLCAGGGQLAQYAIDHGAEHVHMVDEAYCMLNPQFSAKGKAEISITKVESFLTGNVNLFDIIVSRQAVNYWFKFVDAALLYRSLKPNGMLVFNTFGNKPSETPTVREYYHEGRAYKEISYCINDRIHHVQAATGIPPHFTVFDWIDRGDYSMKLKPFFELEEVINGPSSMWYCSKK